MHALLLSPRRRPTPGAIYVAAVALATVLLLGLSHSGIVSPAAALLVCAALGPIGAVVVWSLIGPLQPADVFHTPSIGLDAAVLGAALAIAVVNVLLAALAHRLAGPWRTPGGWASRLPVVTDRLLGIPAFLGAAAIFVVLCVFTGFSFLMASGLDQAHVTAQMGTVRLASPLIFFVGLSAAVGGLVAMILTLVRRLPMLRWAALDLVLQIGLLAALLGAEGLNN